MRENYVSSQCGNSAVIDQTIPILLDHHIPE